MGIFPNFRGENKKYLKSQPKKTYVKDANCYTKIQQISVDDVPASGVSITLVRW